MLAARHLCEEVWLFFFRQANVAIVFEIGKSPENPAQ